MILIYAPEVTDRLKYISKLIFTELLGFGCAFTTFREEFVSYQGPKLVYAPEPLDGELFLESNRLLFEDTMQPCDPGMIRTIFHCFFLQETNVQLYLLILWPQHFIWSAGMKNTIVTAMINTDDSLLIHPLLSKESF